MTAQTSGNARPLRSSIAARSSEALLWTLLSIFAVGLPSVYFATGYGALAASLQAKAEIKVEVVAQAINRSPQMWRFEEHRLHELLTRLPALQKDEYAAIVSESGEVIASSEGTVNWPTVRRSIALFDAGTPAGRVVMQSSLWTLILHSGVVAMLGLAISTVVLVAMRGLLMKNRRIAAAMRDEQERVQVTLRSIGDAVITTDARERIEYLNPVAERLMQWSLEEARGKRLSEVCALVDERTMHAVSHSVTRALKEGQFCAFSGRDLALIRRDGSSVAIEDSAAPLRSAEGELLGSVMVLRDVSTTRRMAQSIVWAATHDALTGLVNRREFEARVDAAMRSAVAAARQDVMCYLDLDQFKIVNDTCGHAAGDALLKQVAGLLQATTRKSDTLARLGGDEFGLLLEGCSLEEAAFITSGLLATVSAFRFTWDEKSFTLGVSIGVVAMGPETGTRVDVFSAADTACYWAKEQGRNRVCVYRSDDIEMAKRRGEMQWAARLTGALENNRLALYYQPYLPLGSQNGQGQHIEILLRMIGDDGKVIAPGSFLPAAERYNLMPSVDRWVIQAVFSRYHDLVHQMGAPLTCCVNLSGTSLNSDGLLEYIKKMALRYSLPPKAICFEITETVAINNMGKTTQFMMAVKALGFSFALDDFGVGTSSLAYLKTLPVDFLKIDGSFIRNIGDDPIDRAMVETINRVGHIMGLQTVGEYAESDEVIAHLRLLGVDYAQGYAVQRPQPLPTGRIGPEVLLNGPSIAVEPECESI
jgi:diguanylate cyclase (GGDEF)-like protein/PAS domain S-box-containing protein